MTDITAKDLTLEEQASLTSGADLWHLQGIPAKDIPGYMITDGPHGLRKAQDSDQLGALQEAVPSTCFPPAAGMASSWNPELTRKVGVAMGEECLQEQVAVILGPGVNMKRNPLGGRCFEYWSEDPLVAGKQAAGLIEGVQSQGVGTSLKHFAANNQETDRLRVSARISERALREIYLRAFEYIVKHAHPWTLMCSYNRINGVYSSENHWLLTDVLRGEWGYDGMVMSDWGAVHDRVATLNGGLNLEMPPSHTDDEVVTAVRMGSISAEQLEAMAQGVLDLINKARPAMEKAKAENYRYDVAAHNEVARQAADESIVLLKNDDDILPLDGTKSVAVIGEFARTPRYQGGGSSHIVPNKLTTVLDGFKEAGVAVDFAPGFTLDDADQDAALTAEAEKLAGSHAVVVMCMGLPELAESEGFDRTSLDIPSKQIDVLRKVAAANPNVVVVLSNGAVVSVAGWQDQAKGLLESWLLGQAGGAAVVDVLMGTVNPSGRLAETIPVRIEDNPSFDTFPGGEGSVDYNEDVFVGYRHYDTSKVAVSYPFGYGLSYTQFEYSNLAVTPVGPTSAHVSVTVTNTGHVAGSDVVQLYVAPPATPATPLARPVHELKEFAKVTLAEGESREVSFDLDSRAFAYWSERLHDWRAVAGEYTIQIAHSSRDIALSAPLTLEGDGKHLPLTGMSTVNEWLSDPKGVAILEGIDGNALLKAVPDEPFARAMMMEMPLHSAAVFGYLPKETLDKAVEAVTKQ
ncbi:MAG: glycoside hydrolase family 3 C-terminal domain-containing protein [Bifidobacteriaceae bacterium]|nr:glycoside hydrolase family 3 C-terminal domain-containing protein [Bifidobacteriaceae bacterium]